MNKNKNRKVISAVLTGAMMTSMIPSIAYAEVPTPDTVTAQTLEANQLTTTVDSAESLVNAVQNAEDGAVIQLTESITLTAQLDVLAGKNIALDLNGKTLDMSGKRIVVAGTLTIRDSAAASGQITGTSGQMIMINRGGKVIHESGTIQTSGYGAVRTQYGSTFEMKGGTIIGDPAIDALNGDVNIIGGTVKLTEGAENLAVVNGEGAIITVGAADAGSQDNPYVEGLDIGDGKTTILNSGFVTDVIGTFAADAVINSTFGSDISDTLPTGMVCTGQDGKYTVSKMTQDNAAAKVGDDYYATVQAAAAAMTEDQTLVLLRDANTSAAAAGAITISAPNCTIDLNGHNITNTSEDGYGISFTSAGTAAKITNSSSTKATIKAAVPTNFASDSGTYTISFDGPIGFQNTAGTNIQSSAGAKLLYSDTAAAAVANGGFKTTEADGKDYIYPTLAEALAVSTDSAVELVNNYSGDQTLDCAKNQTIRLNLQGHTYTYTDEASTKATVNMLGNNGKLTIIDGKIDCGKNAGVDILGSKSKLVLDSVDIIADKADYAISSRADKEGNNLIVKNGSTLSADAGVGIYWPSAGTVTIDSADITAHTGIQIISGDLEITGRNTSITAIGTKQKKPATDTDAILDGSAVSVVKRSGYTAPDSVKILAGSFVSEKENAINAYTYDDDTEKKGTWKNAGKVINITGGNFSEPISEKFLDDSLNYEVISMTYNEAPYSYYTTLSAAETAAAGGDIIVEISDRDSDAQQYGVVLDYDYGNRIIERKVVKGSKIKLPNPKRSGYTFNGWLQGNKIYSAGDTITITGNITLIADWEKSKEEAKEYRVTIAEAAHGSVTIAKEDRWAEEDELILINVKPDKGYELKNVSVYKTANRPVHVWERSDGKYAFVMPDHDVTIMATFVKSGEEVVDMPFIDVHPYNWFYQDVKYVYENGLMTGTAYDKFEPNTSMTRAMIVSVLHRLEGSPKPHRTSPFQDVADNAWYKDPIDWAEGTGIIHGYSVSEFGPNDPITREQMAAILYNYSQYKGKNVSARANLKGYSDYDQISGWAMDVMRWAHAEGLINGMTKNTLEPQGNATRAQVAAIFQRYLED